MTLTLTITRHAGPLPAEGAARSFDGEMVTIGRGEINDWVLPDPERLLSKRHCVIQIQDGRVSVMDTSTNGLFLNGATECVGRGASAALSDGDRLTLGDYEIEVRLAHGAPLHAGPEDPFADLVEQPARAAPAAPGWQSQDAQAQFSPHRDDPFHDPLADPWRPEDEPAPRRPFGPGAEPRSGQLIPEDDDLFGLPKREPWAPAAQEDHLPSHQQAFRPPAAAPLIPEDWESGAIGPPDEPPASPGFEARGLAPASPLAPEPQIPVASEQTVLPHSVSRGDRATAPDVPVPPSAPAPRRSQSDPAPTPPAAPDSARATAGLAAFLAGAGLEDFAPDQEDPEALLRELGSVFREMAEGLREILAARATIKNEFRVERTMIAAADNNPLKFSPGGDEMLRLLLQPRPGYMPGSRAVRDGIEDVKAHQMATMAGMQAAVDAVLAQFDPGVLKGRFDRQSLVDKVVPGARKARYWDLYEAQYRAILKELRDTFLGLFGREFARAYEEQTRKL